MKKYLYRISVATIIVLVFHSCASIVMPEGGAKDVEPPRIKESTPENYTTNFKEKKIFIKFNEFIQLKSANSKLIVSPPLKEKPKLLIKGKTFVVDINNELKDSTTYTFNFGNSIADITEGNSEGNFQFIFSTGDFLDSLEITGTVTDAFTLEKQKDVFVMLYTEHNDSIPLKERPYYITKTDEFGGFRIKCIKTGIYKLFALSDANSNYLFDLPNEKLAFIDTLVTPLVKWKINYDTISIQDTTMSDTLTRDSVIVDSVKVYFPDPINLRLFEEDHQTQYLASTQREKKFKIAFNFNKQLFDSIIEVSEINGQNKDLIYEMNNGFDSLIVWITDSSLYNRDTTTWTLSYLVKDSLEKQVMQTDTVKLVYFGGNTKSKKVVMTDTLLRYKLNVAGGGIFDLNKNVRFIFDHPVLYFDNQLIKLYEYKDTIKHIVQHELIKVKDLYRNFQIVYDYKPDTKYEIEVLPGAFTDYYSLSTDTINLNFTIQKEDYYGNIKLKVKESDGHFIIFFMDEGENIIKTLNGVGSGEFELSYLVPKKYKLKAIIDRNHNNKWDSGNYLKKIQPEKVIYYPEEIDVKSNWDMELEWILEEQKKGSE